MKNSKTEYLHNRSRVNLVEEQKYKKKKKKYKVDLKKLKDKKSIKDNSSPKSTSRLNSSIKDLDNSSTKHKNLKSPFRLLNIIFLFLFSLVAIGNFTLLYNYTIHGQTISDTFSDFAGTSLEVIDTVWEPTLKSTEGYTGFLIMGIDSRDLQFNGEEFLGKDRDIDAIIQVVINNETGNIMMMSIPRDTGVTIEEECVNQKKIWYRSINHGYKMAEDGDCEEGGVGIMEKYVTYVTGFENHYYVLLSYDAFRDVIEAVGNEKDGKKGLYIDVPKTLQEYYPRESGGGFEAVYFPKGLQFIDKIDLLKYARSRKATDSSDRERRQREVLEALFDRVLESDIASDPQKAYKLYQAFQKNALFSEVTLDDIRGAIALARKVDPQKIYHIQVDDTLGGDDVLITRPRTSGGKHNKPGYYFAPMHFNDAECIERNDEYCKVKDYLKQIYNSPEQMTEHAKIVVYSNIKGVKPDNEAYNSGIAKLSLPTTVSSAALPGRDGWGDVQIYDFSDGKKIATKKQLLDAFETQIRTADTAPFEPLNNEDFAIIVKMN